MKRSHPIGLWSALAFLWLWVAASAWVILVQLFVVIWDTPGHWRWPGISKVTVRLIGTDEEGKISGYVWADRDGEDVKLRLARTEAFDLVVDQELWVLHHYRVDGHRPNEFRLTPVRLLGEYPEPLLGLALYLIVGLHRRRKAALKAEAEAPRPDRKVWKDDFHSRAERFSKPDPKPPEG